MRFRPDEVLFAPTFECNLRCAHCDTYGYGRSLGAGRAINFLKQAKKTGVRRVGFTGGEPFLAPGFLFKVVSAAVNEGMIFDRIMTNAVWYRNKKCLTKLLQRLFRAGYDGSICVSVDALHRQSIAKIADFIKTAIYLSKRPDIIQVARITGLRDAKTERKLRSLARALGGRYTRGRRKNTCRIAGVNFFIKISAIDIAPVGRARNTVNPWGPDWFKDDYCAGPGNVFFVTPDGTVLPCCGYSTDISALSIGNINRDSAARLLANAKKNKFVSAVFKRGLGRIRKNLEKEGVVFPGKTAKHCYFCDFITRRVSKDALDKCIS